MYTALTRDGVDVVLKFVDGTGGGNLVMAENEARAIAMMQGPAMVKLLGLDRQHGALLLGRLGERLPDDDPATEDHDIAVAAQIMSQLPRPVPEDSTFPTAHDLHQRFLTIPIGGPRSRAVLRGRDAYRELVAGEPQFVLHGDLFHHNILRDPLGGWRAIDPEPTVADRAFEVATFIHQPFRFRNPRETALVLDRRATTFAEVLGLDKDRILQWTLARSAHKLMETALPIGREQWMLCTEALSASLSKDWYL